MLDARRLPMSSRFRSEHLGQSVAVSFDIWSKTIRLDEPSVTFCFVVSLA
jgi:hypothetical protein